MPWTATPRAASGIDHDPFFAPLVAIKLEGGLQFLIEVKAIGTELKDAHVKQAVDYAANQGTDWVVLTNGLSWRIYKVTFTKPIEHEMSSTSTSAR